MRTTGGGGGGEGEGEDDEDDEDGEGGGAEGGGKPVVVTSLADLMQQMVGGDGDNEVVRFEFNVVPAEGGGAGGLAGLLESLSRPAQPADEEEAADDDESV